MAIDDVGDAFRHQHVKGLSKGEQEVQARRVWRGACLICAGLPVPVEIHPAHFSSLLGCKCLRYHRPVHASGTSALLSFLSDRFAVSVLIHTAASHQDQASSTSVNKQSRHCLRTAARISTHSCSWVSYLAGVSTASTVLCPGKQMWGRSGDTFRETATRPSPVGIDNAFCEPVTATSTPHLSILNGSAPIEETPSTYQCQHSTALPYVPGRCEKSGQTRPSARVQPTNGPVSYINFTTAS